MIAAPLGSFYGFAFLYETLELVAALDAFQSALFRDGFRRVAREVAAFARQLNETGALHSPAEFPYDRERALISRFANFCVYHVGETIPRERQKAKGDVRQKC